MNIQSIVKWVVLFLIIIGALNWGLVGAFHYNAIAAIFGDVSIVTRIIYILVGIAGLFKIFYVFAKK